MIFKLKRHAISVVLMLLEHTHRRHARTAAMAVIFGGNQLDLTNPETDFIMTNSGVFFSDLMEKIESKREGEEVSCLYSLCTSRVLYNS